MLTTIPFQGFYYSIHDQELDQALERQYSDRATGTHVNKALMQRASDDCNWSHVHEEYARAYCSAFGARFALDGLVFDELNCPKEYNFATDRIFARIPVETASRVLSHTDDKRLRELAKERFTSRSGFISSYSPDIEDWGPIEGWDHNQVGTLLAAYADQESNNEMDGFDQFAEYSLMERDQCNGYIEQWINEASPNAARLLRIHDYLQDRAER